MQAGENVRYTLVVKNVGKAHRARREVCDTLPAGVTVTATGGGKLSDGVVCWTVGTLAKAKRKQFTLDGQGRPDDSASASRTRRSPPRATLRARAHHLHDHITLPKPRSGVAGVTG